MGNDGSLTSDKDDIGDGITNEILTRNANKQYFSIIPFQGKIESMNPNANNKQGHRGYKQYTKDVRSLILF